MEYFETTSISDANHDDKHKDDTHGNETDNNHGNMTPQS
jgi:hypothetical protein